MVVHLRFAPALMRCASSFEHRTSIVVLLLDDSQSFLEVQPSHENTQHITAYGPSLELCALMDGCCLLTGTAYDQSCSITHFGRISHDTGPCKTPHSSLSSSGDAKL